MIFTHVIKINRSCTFPTMFRFAMMGPLGVLCGLCVRVVHRLHVLQSLMQVLHLPFFFAHLRHLLQNQHQNMCHYQHEHEYRNW